GEEPQLVPLDGTTDGAIDVEDVMNLVRGRQAEGAQAVVQVVALEAVVAEESGEAPRERVAALFWNRLDNDVGRGGALRQPAARLDGPLFQRRGADDDRGGARSDGVVDGH